MVDVTSIGFSIRFDNIKLTYEGVALGADIADWSAYDAVNNGDPKYHCRGCGNRH